MAVWFITGAGRGFGWHIPREALRRGDQVVAAGRNPAAISKAFAGIVDYKEFAGRSHYTLGQDGWEKVADYALDWALEHTATRGRPVQVNLAPVAGNERIAR